MNLSVIVPILNEIEQLSRFLDMLSRQQGVDLELIMVDGGSRDGSAELIAQRAADYNWPLHLAASEGGRARQLNAGALKASAENLLFLHVDSVFPDPKTLARALEELDRSIAVAGTDAVAGHFRLKFSRTDESSSFGYYFWEVKARLDRSECTHGDQGCLLRKSFFAAVGPFAADLPIAEDTRLAERIRDVGRWILLSPEIWTSARRFEVEGLRERQTLNALIMNFAAIDWADFFSAAKSVYRSQEAADKLDLVKFFTLIDRLNRQTPLLQRLQRWYRTGVYVRPNAWQLAFLRDVKANFGNGVPVDDVELPCLALHDKWFDRVTDNVAGRVVAMIGTWIWYRVTVRYYLRRDS